MSAAACWEDNHPNLPSEIVAILNSTDESSLKGLELLAAIPEWEVDLPGGDRPSQTDILAITRNENDLVLLAVEAKVEEPFGPTLGEKKNCASEGQLNRISYLEDMLGRTTPFPNNIRYQLLHRSVSALLTAKSFHSPIAVMLVHSFSQSSKWRNEFEAFCTELKCTSLSKDVWEVPNIKDGRLLLGWCKGNPDYLAVDLPCGL